MIRLTVGSSLLSMCFDFVFRTGYTVDTETTLVRGFGGIRRGCRTGFVIRPLCTGFSLCVLRMSLLNEETSAGGFLHVGPFCEGHRDRRRRSSAAVYGVSYVVCITGVIAL